MSRSGAHYAAYLTFCVEFMNRRPCAEFTNLRQVSFRAKFSVYRHH